MTTLLFWVVAIVLVASALTVVGARKIVHSALGLVIVFAMAAGIYLLLNAEFIAIVQILIYAGAVTILILFALMLTRTSNQSDDVTNPNSKTWGGGADCERAGLRGCGLCQHLHAFLDESDQLSCNTLRGKCSLSHPYEQCGLYRPAFV